MRTIHALPDAARRVQHQLLTWADGGKLRRQRIGRDMQYLGDGAELDMTELLAASHPNFEALAWWLPLPGGYGEYAMPTQAGRDQLAAWWAETGENDG